MGPRDHTSPLVESQHHVINPTNRGGALDDGVEDWLHVRRRSADDAQHLGRRRLMLQGLPQFCVALLDFLEQTDVLDGDHGLIGESFEKSDLIVCKRTRVRSVYPDGSDRPSVAEQRRGQESFDLSGQLDVQSKIGILAYVGYVGHRGIQNCTFHRGFSGWMPRVPPRHTVARFRRDVMLSN